MHKILDEDTNPIVGEIFRELRSVELQTDRSRFRENLRQVGVLLAYEIAKTLDVREETVQTPLGTRKVVGLSESPVLCMILRAAAPMWEGMLTVFRNSESMFVGAARVEGATRSDDMEMPVQMGYQARPDIDGRDLILADPMVATGSTMIGIYQKLIEEGVKPRRTIIAGVIGFRGAIERLEEAIPGVEIWLASCDDKLDENSYIVPGLGDAGDLCFGPKL